MLTTTQLPTQHFKSKDGKGNWVKVFGCMALWQHELANTHWEALYKTLKQVGLIYRTFYQYSIPACLQQLYLSFVKAGSQYDARASVAS